MALGMFLSTSFLTASSILKYGASLLHQKRSNAIDLPTFVPQFLKTNLSVTFRPGQLNDKAKIDFISHFANVEVLRQLFRTHALRSVSDFNQHLSLSPILTNEINPDISSEALAASESSVIPCTRNDASNTVDDNSLSSEASSIEQEYSTTGSSTHNDIKREVFDEEHSIFSSEEQNSLIASYSVEGLTPIEDLSTMDVALINDLVLGNDSALVNGPLAADPLTGAGADRVIVGIPNHPSIPYSFGSEQCKATEFSFAIPIEGTQHSEDALVEDLVSTDPTIDAAVDRDTVEPPHNPQITYVFGSEQTKTNKSSFGVPHARSPTPPGSPVPRKGTLNFGINTNNAKSFEAGLDSIANAIPFNSQVTLPSPPTSDSDQTVDSAFELKSMDVEESEGMKLAREKFEKEEHAKETKGRFMEVMNAKKVNRKRKGAKGTTKAAKDEDKSATLAEISRIPQHKGKGHGKAKYRAGKKGVLVEPGKS